METRIREAVHAYLESIGAGVVLFTVERPADMTHGDYATNAALAAAKTVGKPPREIADGLAVHLVEALGEDASHIAVAGPGFVNIMLSRAAVTGAVAEADAKGEEWGRGTTEAGRRIFVEYSNPNAFKEMHAGHLVGTIVGESLSRLIENEGATVARDTFGGDVGPNVAKALWALQKQGITEPENAQQIGEAYAVGAKAYEDNPKAKEEMDALNQAIYAGTDEAVMDLWHRGREISMGAFRQLWKMLGTHFDFEFFDSDTTETGVRVVKDGLEKGIFKESEGAIIYDGEAKGVHTMVFITSKHTPTYEAKDIGLAFMKEERWPSDEVIILTGNEQTGRFETVLAALGDINAGLAAKMRHVATGFLRLTSGKMSSREGNVITARELIEDVVKKASKKNDDPLVAEQVAVGAIKFMVLRQSPGSDIVFDPEQSLSLEGDSGPYLQYALVRAKSVLERDSESPSSKTPDAPYPIERVILHYPAVAARAAQELSPNLLVTYLLELAGAWNAFYTKERIIGDDYEMHKRIVARAFVHTMQNGLTMLGIPIPEKM